MYEFIPRSMCTRSMCISIKLAIFYSRVCFRHRVIDVTLIFPDAETIIDTSKVPETQSRSIAVTRENGPAF